ncbi:hypothetical protein L6164_019911 [Bauhinia variegata]|uniref:Uncharacterized protein n=1 Tax=Bauhinia variegata TaxID=167791 RepID=A0ACB9MWS1_BAUVA|nr:hypothetical protein L6164_019911 [Bauhinia variegata]
MKKSSASSKSLGSFPSPGAPIYREKSLGGQKGWSSERVPQRAISSTRHASVTGLPAFYSGRTLPSKWDDAERWICSPLSGYVNSTSSNAQLQIQRRPKSKSGPIVPPGIAYYSNYSPAIPLVDGLGMKNLMVGVGSPFSTGVLAPDAVSVLHYHYDARNGPHNCPTRTDNSVAPSSSSAPPSCSQPLCLCDSLDEGTENEEMVTCVVSKCDKATQMSPERENNSQSSEKSSPTCSKTKGPLSDYFAKLEVRDVQVDNQATVTRWSKRYGTKLTKKDSPQSKDLSQSGKEDTSRDLAVSTIDIYKLQREEAKIIAWENLQKAKTEEAIRKLEMKLEKKRSSSMNKIASKLRRAQRKAEKMRSSLPVKQEEHQLSKTTKGFSFPKHPQIMFPSNCFGCHHP